MDELNKHRRTNVALLKHLKTWFALNTRAFIRRCFPQMRSGALLNSEQGSNTLFLLFSFEYECCIGVYMASRRTYCETISRCTAQSFIILTEQKV